MIRKILASTLLAVTMSAAVAAGAFAAADPGGAALKSAPTRAEALKHHQEARDVFHGKVTAISSSELTVRNKAGESKTFLRTEGTQVFRGRKDKSAWSEIEINSHVAVRFEERDGKLYARAVYLSWAHVSGKVQRIEGSTITIATRDGREVRVTTSERTRFIERQKKGQKHDGSLRDLRPGMSLMAVGKRNAGGSFDAGTVIYWTKSTR
jgi:hypothetical protein